MFENYLLNPSAIAAVLNILDQSEVTEPQVSSWIEQNKTNAKYYKDIKCSTDQPWTNNVNGAVLLFNAFKSLSGGKISFVKTEHSPMLTKWLLENSLEELRELSNLIENVLSGS